MVVVYAHTPDRIYHPSHLGEVYVDASYSRVHDLCGHPQCGCAPGVSIVRDPTDHHWVMVIPVQHSKPAQTIEFPLQDSPDVKTADGPVWRCYYLGILIATAITLPLCLIIKGIKNALQS